MTKPLNVLIIAQYFPPDLGGAATRAYNLAKGLALNGCNVTVIAAVPHYPHGKISKEYRWRPLKIERMDNFKVIRTFMPPIKSEGFFKRLLLIGNFAVSALFALPIVGKVDAVWASSWMPGYVYSKIKRKPLAINIDDLTLEDLVDLKLLEKDSILLKVASSIYRIFYVKADILTPISEGYIETMIKKYCVKPERIHLVRGGVDLSTFKPIPMVRETNSKFVVMYSGAFSVAYNFELIILAAKIIESNDENIEFIIQGSGELLGEMQRLARKLGVKNVKIINKIISRTEVAKQLSTADVLILPLAALYKSEQPYRGMSSKLYEYQAVGKPIISCSRGLPSDYVVNTESGLSIDSSDSQDLAKAVLYLKNNPDRAAIFGKNGRAYVENEASIQIIGAKLKNCFTALVEL